MITIKQSVSVPPFSLPRPFSPPFSSFFKLWVKTWTIFQLPEALCKHVSPLYLRDDFLKKNSTFYSCCHRLCASMLRTIKDRSFMYNIKSRYNYPVESNVINFHLISDFLNSRQMMFCRSDNVFGFSKLLRTILYIHLNSYALKSKCNLQTNVPWCHSVG